VVAVPFYYRSYKIHGIAAPDALQGRYERKKRHENGMTGKMQQLQISYCPNFAMSRKRLTLRHFQNGQG
jgi:hypothetical protein